MYYMLTLEEKTAYNASDRSKCPGSDCHSSDLEQSDFVTDKRFKKTAWRKITCLECGRMWLDVFTFTTIAPIASLTDN